MIGRKWKRVFRVLWVMAGLSGVAWGEEATKLEPIVVTATRIEQKVSEQASSVSVVTREDIELKNPATAGDVLQGIPGLDVQRQGSPGGLENIKIRGGLSTHTLVMIDGFPVNSPALSMFDISSLPVDDFDRVEVVRGAQSALYGSYAIGGVVNFIPPKGGKERQYDAGLAAGSFRSLKWHGAAQDGGTAGSLYVGAVGWKSDGILPNDDFSLASYMGVAEVPIGSRSRIHAIMLSTEGTKGVPVDYSGRDINHRFIRRGLLTGVRYEVDVANGVTVTASGSIFDEFLHTNDPAEPGETSSLDDVTKTRKGLLRLEGRISPAPFSTTFVGVEYQKDRMTDSNVFTDTMFGSFPSFNESSVYNRSVFLQEELRAGKHSGLSLGARLDRNSLAGTEFNPKVAAFHEISAIGTRVRVAVGRGFRPPTASEKFDPYVGNPDLSSEKAVSYEAGADATLPGKKVSLAATWFYQNFKPLIQYDPDVWKMRNMNAFSRGVEAEALFQVLTDVGLGVKYTYSDTWIAEKQRRILGIPRQRGTAYLLYTPVPAFHARLDWRLESDQLDKAPFESNISRRPGYAMVDFFARYRWDITVAAIREFALTGKMQNLLNRDYEERKGYPSPGFNFLLGAELKI